jgi:hypothetical protein
MNVLGFKPVDRCNVLIGVLKIAVMAGAVSCCYCCYCLS